MATAFLLLITFLSLRPSSSAPYDPTLYTLGVNLILNPAFTQPHLGSSTQYQNVAFSIPSWNCSHICQIINIPLTFAAYSLQYSTNYSQCIDMDSNHIFETISQKLNIPVSASYLLHIDWLPSPYLPLGKSFEVGIDSVVVGGLTCTDANYTNHVY
jgi:hypothetical protein